MRAIYQAARVDKPLVWLADEIGTPPFSASARIEAGVLLRRLQRGELLHLPQSRPMPRVGRRCHELRIPDEGVAWRIMYRLDPDAVVIVGSLCEEDAGNAAVGASIVSAPIADIRPTLTEQDNGKWP